jgi:arginine N-succinyltransferase
VFIIRQAKVEDVPTLVKLAKMVLFINLPADREIIHQKIVRSRECFVRAAGGKPAKESPARDAKTNGSSKTGGGVSEFAKHGDFFMFALEDTETGACLGTSQIVGHMGGPGNPNFTLKLRKKEFFSESLQTGTSHIVARLHADESGPTEIGGLILQPASRGHKLGRLLSLIRFHWVALHRKHFADRIIAEMMGAVTADGHSVLWDYLGRRFIPLSYSEADKHCQRSREFISALLPKEDIYLSLLPPEARDVVGKVSDETIPARRMLEKLGFVHKDEVDAFDGGPVLAAKTDSVSVVKDTGEMVLGDPGAAAMHLGFVSNLAEDGEFRAVQTEYAVDAKGRVSVPWVVMDELKWEKGMTVGVTGLEKVGGGKGSKRVGAKARA